MKLIVAALAVVFSTAALAGGARFAGNDLHERLSGEEYPGSHFRKAWALGYIAGVYDSRDGLCVPDDINAQQVIDVVTIWLTRNPKYRHYRADGLVVLAINEAWPCPKDNR